MDCVYRFIVDELNLANSFYLLVISVVFGILGADYIASGLFLRN